MDCFGVKFCRIKNRLEKMVEFKGIIDDAVATIKDEERTVHELEGQGELVQDELERAEDRIKRLASLGLKGVRKAKRIKKWLAENIPPGPKLVEYMAASTVSDVRYVRFHLRREDIGVLVFIEDWGAEELSMIDELGGSLDVPVVRRSSLEHPPTEFYTINRDSIRNLKIGMSTCERIIVELNSYDKEVEREAVKTIVMENKGSDPQDLFQQKAVLARSKMVVADCHKRLEAALTDLKGTLAELLQSGWSGQEIGQARTAISEADTLLSTDET